MDCIQETKVFTENVVEIDNFSEKKEIDCNGIQECQDSKNEIIFNKIENSIENSNKCENIEISQEQKPVVEDKRNATQKAVDELFQPDLSGCSPWVAREDIANNEKLNWGNNGNGRHGVYFGDNRYVWEKQTTKCRISALRTIGFNEDVLYGANRPIRDDIHKIIKSKPCVVCGSKSHLVTDHKNDLYNDLRVLNSKTQIVDDFQCLCNHCNLQKRQISKQTKIEKKRYGATNIPHLAMFNIDFISGDETFDPNDPNAMVGTYWYDPVAFMEHIKQTMMSK